MRQGMGGRVGYIPSLVALSTEQGLGRRHSKLLYSGEDLAPGTMRVAVDDLMTDSQFAPRRAVWLHYRGTRAGRVPPFNREGPH